MNCPYFTHCLCSPGMFPEYCFQCTRYEYTGVDAQHDPEFFDEGLTFEEQASRTIISEGNYFE